MYWPQRIPPSRQELTPICIRKADLDPETKNQVNLLYREMEAIISFCKREAVYFSPPGTPWSRPDIIKLGPDQFIYVEISPDAICLKQLSREEARQIAEESIEQLHRMGRMQEEEELASLIEEIF